MIFDEWKKEVDVVCISAFGVSSDDLPDCLWYDYWQDSMSPSEAVECAVEDTWGSDNSMYYELWYGSAAVGAV